jgi:hypothetical protein
MDRGEQGIDGVAVWRRSTAVNIGRRSAVAPVGSYSTTDKRWS